MAFAYTFIVVPLPAVIVHLGVTQKAGGILGANSSLDCFRLLELEDRVRFLPSFLMPVDMPCATPE